MLARHRTTGKEYAVKVLDKGHLKRNNKLPTALAEKNTLVRLGVGHPGIVHLHSTFQDEWSLCESMATCLEGEITRQALQTSFLTWRDMASCSHEYRGWDRCRPHVLVTIRLSLQTLWITCITKASYTGSPNLSYDHRNLLLSLHTRDLKPENLLLDDNYRLKLTDFGTGKVLTAGGNYSTLVISCAIFT